MNPLTFITPMLKHVRHNARFEPSRDWLVILTISLIALVCICTWNAWAFDTVSQGGIIGKTVVEPTPVFSRSSLDAIENIFSHRATEEAKYVTGVYRYADPSQ